MLWYKVLVIERNNLLIGHMFDFESKIEDRKYLHTLLKEAQKRVVKEVQIRKKLFDKTISKEELIKERGIIILPDDKVTIHSVGVEFGYNGYYRLSEI